MSVWNRAIGVFGVTVLGFSLGWGAEPVGAKFPKIIFLSIDEYVQLCLRQGTRAMTAYNNFQNATFSQKSIYRQLWLPSMQVESEVSEERTEVNSDSTYTENAEGSATLSQPFYPTGGELSARYFESNTRDDISADTVIHSYTRPEYSATFTQPLFLFVGNTSWRTWQRAKLSYDIAEDNYRREMQSIENESRAVYYNVLLKTAQVDVEKTKLESSRRGNGITKALVNAGRLAGIELTRSDLRLQEDGRRAKNADTALAQSINNAAEFASMKIESEIRFTSDLFYEPLSLLLPDLIDHAFQHRPDYMAAKHRVELSKIEVMETAEGDHPSLNAVGSFSHSRSSDGFPPDTVENFWSGGLNMSWPLFDSGVTTLREKRAENNLENTRIDLQSLERKIKTDVTNAFLEVKRTEEQLDDIQASKVQARQSVEAVRIRYQNGRDRLIDVFDSEQQLRDLELEYLNVLISANLAKDRLALLIGSPLQEVLK